MPIINLQQISKIYGFGDATTVALEEIDLKIDKAEFVAVMGPSGSGKSTLMNIIGLLDHPSHGQYFLNGKSVSRFGQYRRAKWRRDNIGFIFQSFNLLPKLTVLENVALPLAYKGVTQTRRLKQAGRIIERVGLADREHFLPKQLSGGQAQRVAIARALVNNPQIIIADEPTGNLDSQSSRLVMELLSEIHKAGDTILMVTHNPEVTRYATRVVFMHDGQVIADELSALGEIPKSLKRSMYYLPRYTAEDDYAGVSAIMHNLEKPQTKTSKRRAKTKPAKTKYSRRQRSARSKK